MRTSTGSPIEDPPAGRPPVVDLSVMAAQAHFYARAWAHPEYAAYLRRHRINVERISSYAGATGMMSIVDCGNGRFDWCGGGEVTTGFICEALDEDCEAVVDLVAWPVDRPRHLLTMFGRASLLGLWEAQNPATYYLDQPLRMHREALGWLQSGCKGAAVAHEVRAARILIDLPGKIAAEDWKHKRELERIIAGVLGKGKVVVATADAVRAA
jgi:hypothetical protein